MELLKSIIFLCCLSVKTLSVKVPVRPNEESLRVLINDPGVDVQEINLFKDLNPQLIVRKQDELVKDSIKNVEEKSGVNDKEKEKILNQYLNELRRVGEEGYSGIRNRNLQIHKQPHEDQHQEAEDDEDVEKKSASQRVSKSEKTFDKFYDEPLPERKKTKKESHEVFDEVNIGDFFQNRRKLFLKKPKKNKSSEDSSEDVEKHETSAENPKSYHENPPEVPTKVNYPGRGQWARKIEGVTHSPHNTIHKHLYPEKIKQVEDEEKEERTEEKEERKGQFDILDRNKNVYDDERESYFGDLKKYADNYNADATNHEVEPEDFVPYRSYSQVRRSDVERRIPKKKKKDKRVKEIQKNSKAHTVYTEEGYEDSAYDHGGSQKQGDKTEKDRRVQNEDEGLHEEESRPLAPEKPQYDDNEEEESRRNEDPYEEERKESRIAQRRIRRRNDSNRREIEERIGKIEEPKKSSTNKKNKKSKPIVTREGEPEKYFTFENEDWFQKYRFDNINDFFTVPPDVVENPKPKKSSKKDENQSPPQVVERKDEEPDRVEASIKNEELIKNSEKKIEEEQLKKIEEIKIKPKNEQVIKRPPIQYVEVKKPRPPPSLPAPPPKEEIPIPRRNVVQEKIAGEERLRKIQERRRQQQSNSNGITKRKVDDNAEEDAEETHQTNQYVPEELLQKSLDKEPYQLKAVPVYIEYFQPPVEIPEEQVEVNYPVVKNVEKNPQDVKEENGEIRRIYERKDGDENRGFAEEPIVKPVLINIAKNYPNTEENEEKKGPKISGQIQETMAIYDVASNEDNFPKFKEEHEDLLKFREKITKKNLDDFSNNPKFEENQSKKVERVEEHAPKVHEPRMSYPELITNIEDTYSRNLYINKNNPKTLEEQTTNVKDETKTESEGKYFPKLIKTMEEFYPESETIEDKLDRIRSNDNRELAYHSFETGHSPLTTSLHDKVQRRLNGHNGEQFSVVEESKEDKDDEEILKKLHEENLKHNRDVHEENKRIREMLAKSRKVEVKKNEKNREEATEAKEIVDTKIEEISEKPVELNQTYYYDDEGDNSKENKTDEITQNPIEKSGSENIEEIKNYNETERSPPKVIETIEDVKQFINLKEESVENSTEPIKQINMTINNGTINIDLKETETKDDISEEIEDSKNLKVEESASITNFQGQPKIYPFFFGNIEQFYPVEIKNGDNDKIYYYVPKVDLTQTQKNRKFYPIIVEEEIKETQPNKEKNKEAEIVTEGIIQKATVEETPVVNKDEKKLEVIEVPEITSKKYEIKNIEEVTYPYVVEDIRLKNQPSTEETIRKSYEESNNKSLHSETEDRPKKSYVLSTEEIEDNTKGLKTIQRDERTQQIRGKSPSKSSEDVENSSREKSRRNRNRSGEVAKKTRGKSRGNRRQKDQSGERIREYSKDENYPKLFLEDRQKWKESYDRNRNSQAHNYEEDKSYKIPIEEDKSYKIPIEEEKQQIEKSEERASDLIDNKKIDEEQIPAKIIEVIPTTSNPIILTEEISTIPYKNDDILEKESDKKFIEIKNDTAEIPAKIEETSPPIKSNPFEETQQIFNRNFRPVLVDNYPKIVYVSPEDFLRKENKKFYPILIENPKQTPKILYTKEEINSKDLLQNEKSHYPVIVEEIRPEFKEILTKNPEEHIPVNEEISYPAKVQETNQKIVYQPPEEDVEKRTLETLEKAKDEIQNFSKPKIEGKYKVVEEETINPTTIQNYVITTERSYPKVKYEEIEIRTTPRIYYKKEILKQTAKENFNKFYPSSTTEEYSTNNEVNNHPTKVYENIEKATNSHREFIIKHPNNRNIEHKKQRVKELPRIIQIPKKFQERPPSTPQPPPPRKLNSNKVQIKPNREEPEEKPKRTNKHEETPREEEQEDERPGEESREVSAESQESSEESRENSKETSRENGRNDSEEESEENSGEETSREKSSTEESYDTQVERHEKKDREDDEEEKEIERRREEKRKKKNHGKKYKSHKKKYSVKNGSSEEDKRRPRVKDEENQRRKDEEYQRRRDEEYQRRRNEEYQRRRDEENQRRRDEENQRRRQPETQRVRKRVVLLNQKNVDIPRDENEDEVIDKVMAEQQFGAKIRRKRSTEESKYPNYNSKNLDKSSSLRYAENPQNILIKTKDQMVLYDRIEEVECPDTEDINPIPEKLKNPKNETVKTNHTDYDPKTRLKGKLSHQIDCLKRRYFGDNPLDNPIFNEEYDGAISSQVFENNRKPKGLVEEKDVKEGLEQLPSPEAYVMRRRVIRRPPYPVLKGNYEKRPLIYRNQPKIHQEIEKDEEKPFSEVHYKEEIKPSEQLNVFADIINNIKTSNEDTDISESKNEEVYVERPKVRYRRTRSTTSKPFLPTPVPPAMMEKNRRIPTKIRILPEHSEADEIIIVKKPPSNNHKHRNQLEESLEEENFVSEEIFDKNIEKFNYIGLRPPPKEPFRHPNLYQRETERRRNPSIKRRRIKRNTGYSEIRRNKNETNQDVDEYVPKRERNFHYDEKTGRIVYDKKKPDDDNDEEYDYIEIEEVTQKPEKTTKEKKKEKRFPPTPPPGPSYLDYITILKKNPNYKVIEDPKPTEKEEMTENAVTSSESSGNLNNPSSTGIPEFLMILNKVKADKSYKVYLDPTPETKKSKSKEEDKKNQEIKEEVVEDEVDEDEDVEEVQNSPGLQGVLGEKSKYQIFDVSEFLPKPKDYSPKTSVDTSKYTNIRRNPKKQEENPEKSQEDQVSEEILTTTPQSQTIDIPTTSSKPTTPIEEVQTARYEIKTRRTVRRRPTTTSSSQESSSNSQESTTPPSSRVPQRRQRGRARFRFTTPAPLKKIEENVRSRRNLQRKNYEIPRNHRRDYTKSRNDIETFKPTPRTITWKLINQTDFGTKIPDDNKSKVKVEEKNDRTVEDDDKAKKQNGNYKFKKVQIKITRNFKPEEKDENEDNFGKDLISPKEFYSDPKLPERVNTLKERNNYELTETFFQEDTPLEDEDDQEESYEYTTTTRRPIRTTTKPAIRRPKIIKDPSKRLYFYAPI